MPQNHRLVRVSVAVILLIGCSCDGGDDDNDGHVGEGANIRCTSSEECPADRHCGDNGFCMYGCSSYADCPEGFSHCEAGECMCMDSTCDTDLGFECRDGICRCTEGLECKGGCVLIWSDPSNCGECGAACGEGEICEEGVCKGACDPLTTCDDVCVDTLNDPGNCGTCGNTCNTAGGQRCNDGVCGCMSGLNDCSGECVDLNSDEDNCGTCGNTCDIASIQICSDGKCI